MKIIEVADLIKSEQMVRVVDANNQNSGEILFEGKAKSLKKLTRWDACEIDVIPSEEGILQIKMR